MLVGAATPKKSAIQGRQYNCRPNVLKTDRPWAASVLPGTPVGDAVQPVELLRAVQSFDPCLVFSAHYPVSASNSACVRKID
jgi:Ni,Fe-hydrogenase I large subunit